MLCYLHKNDLRDKRKRRLEGQFKDYISGVSANLQAGYSIENAFIKSGKDLNVLYSVDADIRMEAERVRHLLENNITLEKILTDFGKRSGSQDIQNFAEVFAASKRSGGDFREMIESCCQVILMKLEVEKEIQLMIHGKKIEQRIMCLVPFMIMLYISMTSPGYFHNLYHNVAGIIVMTICLFIYLFSVVLSDRMTRIEV